MDEREEQQSPFNGTPRCNARSKRSGGQCKNPAMPNGKCRLHGGLTPSGIASPHFRTGMYSRAMPKALRSRFARAMKDPDLLSLDQEVALLTVRTTELLDTLAQTEQPPWGKAVESLNDLAQALRSGDSDEIQAAFARHNDTVRTGAQAAASYSATWGELREVMLEKAKVSRAESSRIHEINGTLTVAQAMSFVTAVLESVKRNISDRPTLQRVQDDVNRLLAAPAPVQIEVNGK